MPISLAARKGLSATKAAANQKGTIMVLLFLFALAEIALMGAAITWDVLHPRLSSNNEAIEAQTQKAGANFAAALPRTDWSISHG